jgi:hypothetical protein
VKQEKPNGHVVDRKRLPTAFPTHKHEPAFWEALGRAVGTFGFLEETLLKAIFAITATTPYEADKIDAAYAAWVPTLKRSLSDPLGGLIDTYAKAVKNHRGMSVDNFAELVIDLRAACKIRNAICHGSWHSPNAEGLSIPFYINKQREKFETPIGVVFLEQLRNSAASLACSVVDTVTHMGWQFPSSSGPGKVIWPTAEH